MLKKLVISVSLLALLAGIFNPGSVLAANSGQNITWVKTTKESECNDYYDITYNKDKFYVVVGKDGAVVRSEDAKAWKKIPLQTSENLNAIATNGKQFVAVGNNGIIIQSANGKSWTKESASFSAAYTYEQITGKMRSYTEDSYKVKWAAKPKQSQLQFKDVLWDGKKYVAIAQWEVDTGSLKEGGYSYSLTQLHLSSNFILTSKDGKKWIAKYVDVPDLEKIVYTGSRYTAISEESVSSSTDLTKWKTTTPNIRGNFTDIIYSNGKYMTIGWDGNISARTGTIYTSSDGVKWKAVINKEIIGSGISEEDDTYGKPNGFSDLIMYSALWDGKQYVIAGYNGMILTSKSGTNWELLNKMWDVTFEPFAFSDWTGPLANIQKIIYDGEQYIQVGNNGTILVSGDLKTGTVAHSRPSVDFENITYDGGSRYLAHGKNDTIWESENGYNWRQVELTEVTETLYWRDIASYRGTAIAICQTKIGWLSYDTPFYYYSDKPGSWTKMNFPKKVSLVYGAKYIKDKYYVFTRDGIITSKDGKTWSGFSVTKTLLQNITYNGKIYIGQTASFTEEVSENALYTSLDCKKWSKIIINKDGKKYYLSAANVVWNGKQFVTIGGQMHLSGDGFSGKKIVAFSSDGISWKIKDGDDNYYTYGVYGNKNYMAIDNTGNLYYSSNGIDYTKSAKGTSQSLYTALWDGKKFLVAGEMGVILASTKDKNVTIPA
ncbi:MAG: hypothetical protein K0R46_1787, partial [Herbinix sp.]|nr:hypothetical protein [Herbinix sp.]